MSHARRYLGFVAMLVLISGVLILIGIEPSRRLGGEEAVRGLLAGCALSVLSSVVGSVPVLLSGIRSDRVIPMLASVCLRFLAALAGAAVLVTRDSLEPRAFLLWLGISYLALLVVDVRFALGPLTPKSHRSRT